MGIIFWGVGQHEPFIVAFFISVVSYRYWKGSCKSRGGGWSKVTVRYFNSEYKREWKQLGPIKIGGRMR